MPQDRPPAAPAGQALQGFLSNEEWDALIGQVDALVGRMEALPAGQVRSDVFQLLDGIDAIHREALRRLVRLFKEGVLEQVVSDPAIHTLMELYDLLPSPAAATGAAEQAPEQAPGRTRFPTIPIRAVAAGGPAPLRHPHWVPVLADADTLPSGSLRSVRADGLPLLLARRDRRLFAVDGSCPLDGAPMDDSSFNGFTLSCPNHAGCHYDVRNGQRLGGGAPLQCHPVKQEEGGRVLVGLDMDFTPDVPSF